MLPTKTFWRLFSPQSCPRDWQRISSLFSEVVGRPFAVRSSSLLEDSHYQPFAGIYATYMVPWTADPVQRLRGSRMPQSNVCMRRCSSRLRKLYDRHQQRYRPGEDGGDYPGGCRARIMTALYFPTFSGVGRSLNYYPLGDEKPDDGVGSGCRARKIHSRRRTRTTLLAAVSRPCTSDLDTRSCPPRHTAAAVRPTQRRGCGICSKGR